MGKNRLTKRQQKQQAAELAQAVEQFRAIEADGRIPSYGKIAASFKSGLVARTTLYYRHKDIRRDQRDAHHAQQLLTPEQESILVMWICVNGYNGRPLDPNDIVSRATDIIGHPPGKHWIERFMVRHAHRIKKNRAYALDPKRGKNFTLPTVTELLDALQQIIAAEEIPRENMYNPDEIGTQMCGGRKVMAKHFLFAAEDRDMHSLRSDDLELATVLETTCADGTDAIKPCFITKPGDLGNWYECDYADRIGLVSASENGWTNNGFYKAWFRDHFIPSATARNVSGRPILLIMDGHGSHLTDDVVELACDNNVILFLLPAKCTHKLQPLDVGVFNHIQRAWRARAFERAQQLCPISRKDIIPEYMSIRHHGFTSDIILSAWRRSGLSPVDITVFRPEEFAPSENFSTQVHVPDSFFDYTTIIPTSPVTACFTDSDISSMDEDSESEESGDDRSVSCVSPSAMHPLYDNYDSFSDDGMDVDFYLPPSDQEVTPEQPVDSPRGGDDLPPAQPAFPEPDARPEQQPGPVATQAQVSSVLPPPVPPISPFIQGFPRSTPLRSASAGPIRTPRATPPSLSGSPYLTRSRWSTRIQSRVVSDNDNDDTGSDTDCDAMTERTPSTILSDDPRDIVIAQQRDEIRLLQAQISGADAHNTMLYRENEKLRTVHARYTDKRKKKSKDDGSTTVTVKMGPLNPTQMKEHVKAQVQERQKRRAEEDAERQAKENKKQEEHRARMKLAYDPNHVWDGSWTSYVNKKRDVLLTIAEELALSPTGTKQQLFDAITAHFEANPTKKTLPRYENLWSTGRARSRAVPAAAAPAPAPTHAHAPAPAPPSAPVPAPAPTPAPALPRTPVPVTVSGPVPVRQAVQLTGSHRNASAQPAAGAGPGPSTAAHRADPFRHHGAHFPPDALPRLAVGPPQFYGQFPPHMAAYAHPPYPSYRPY